MVSFFGWLRKQCRLATAEGAENAGIREQAIGNRQQEKQQQNILATDFTQDIRR